MIICILYQKIKEVHSTVYEIITHSAEETEGVGMSLAEKAGPGAVIAMRGGLGAGKTAFVRGFASAMGVSDRVTSPTFTIVNEYEGRIPIFHFDMYRLCLLYTSHLFRIAPSGQNRHPVTVRRRFLPVLCCYAQGNIYFFSRQAMCQAVAVRGP